MAHCWSSFPPLMDMDWKYGSNQKMSSFLLFEASGDSEEDFRNHPDYDHDSNNLYSLNLFSKSPGVSAVGQHDGGGGDDDDAESCSCDSVDMLIGLQDHDFIINNFNHQAFSITCDRDGGGGGGGSGDHDDNILRCDRHLKEFEFPGARVEDILPPEEGEEESGVGVHGGGEVVMMDEEERNRLFWETCLQVGLPMNYTQ